MSLGYDLVDSEKDGARNSSIEELRSNQCRGVISTANI